MQRLLDAGLAKTAALWPPVRAAYAWVERAAAILANDEGLTGAAVRRRYAGLLGALARAAPHAGTLRGALAHFQKVTRSYWPGLFHADDVADLPRTNNGLEQLFGAHRYHERRASGRKTAAPGSVVRGSARLVAGTLTRLRPATGPELQPHDLAAWRALRAGLANRAALRTLGRRFRRDPDRYLATLEAALFKPTLPS